jgi:hypothetical protein
MSLSHLMLSNETTRAGRKGRENGPHRLDRGHLTMWMDRTTTWRPGGWHPAVLTGQSMVARFGRALRPAVELPSLAHLFSVE